MLTWGRAPRNNYTGGQLLLTYLARLWFDSVHFNKYVLSLCCVPQRKCTRSHPSSPPPPQGPCPAPRPACLWANFGGTPALTPVHSVGSSIFSTPDGRPWHTSLGQVISPGWFLPLHLHSKLREGRNHTSPESHTQSTNPRQLSGCREGGCL